MAAYQLDNGQIRRGFDRAASRYDENAVLARVVDERLLERLDLVAIDPEVIVDLGAGTGRAGKALQQRYSSARVILIDSSAAMLQRCVQRPRVRGDAMTLPLQDSCVDLVHSNLMLPWCDDLDAALQHMRRVMKPHGLLSFSTYGPDTLVELRASWRQVDTGPHVHGFIDMHDIGDALVRAGFTEPVMDVERFTLTYATLDRLLLDLRLTGSANAWPDRARGLLGTGCFSRLADAYESHRDAERLPATFEVIYGHAWCPPTQSPVAPETGIAQIPVNRIGRRRR